MKPNEKITILGAGPAGLSIGFALSEQQKEVTVLEKQNVCGGMAITFEKDGCHFDLGPHIVHTSHADVLAFLKKILGPDLVKCSSKIQIYFNGRFVNYPLKGLRVLSVLPRWQAGLALIHFLWARILMFLRDPKDERSFKAWITNRFGRTLYNIYFGPYAEKAWKIPADQISAYVARKRVPTLSLTDYLRTLLKAKPKAYHSEDPTCVEIFYPRLGVGQVVQFFEKKIRENGGKIETSVNVKAVHHSDGKIRSVTIERNGVESRESVDFLFSTIPVNDFVKLLSPAPPRAVFEAAEKLDYCSERLLYIVVNKEEIFEAPLLYFQNPKVKFNRVYGVRKYGPECLPPGKEALIVEFTCSYGDDTWNAPDKQLYDEAMHVFTGIGALKHEDVHFYFSKHVSHAYPRFRVGFQRHLRTIFEYLGSIQNLTVLGRQGLFCYANVDEVIAMGFKALEIYPSMEWKTIDYPNLFKEFVHID